MLRFPLNDGNEFVIIEPGNIERLKEGKPLIVGGSMVAFTPDMEALAKMLGTKGTLPNKNEQRVEFVSITPEQIEAALRACQKLPEVLR